MKQLRFYEAIRLGAAMKPQAFGLLLSLDKQRTCAYGAALDAVGLLTDENLRAVRYIDGIGDHGQGFALLMDATQRMRSLFPFTLSSIACPLCCRDAVESPISLVTHLNDHHRWTRNQIADFIQPIEDAWWAAQEAIAPPQSETPEIQSETQAVP